MIALQILACGTVLGLLAAAVCIARSIMTPRYRIPGWRRPEAPDQLHRRRFF